MPLDEQHVVDATCGPVGMVTGGVAFDERDVPSLKWSYGKLEHTLAAQAQGGRASFLREAVRRPPRVGAAATVDAPGEGAPLGRVAEEDDESGSEAGGAQERRVLLALPAPEGRGQEKDAGGGRRGRHVRLRADQGMGDREAQEGEGQLIFRYGPKGTASCCRTPFACVMRRARHGAS